MRLIKICKRERPDPLFLVAFISFYISRHHFSQRIHSTLPPSHPLNGQNPLSVTDVFCRCSQCNATRDQASDVVLRKWLCIKHLCRHVIENRSRADLQASNCARVSIKLGRATRNKRQLLKLSKRPMVKAQSIA